MKYISIDIETTGLDPETCQILSVGAVIEDTNNLLPIEELPRIHIAILRENIAGSMFAINLNKSLIESIVHYQTAKDQDEKNDIVQMTNTLYLKEEAVVETLFHFCYEHGIIENLNTEDWSHAQIGNYFTQKNGKMYPMLTPNMQKVYLNCAGKNFAGFDRKFLERLPRWKQVFAIRSRVLDPGILFVDWKNDESVPGLYECKQRAGIDGVVTHNAVEDAIDVVMLLRKNYE